MRSKQLYQAASTAEVVAKSVQNSLSMRTPAVLPVQIASLTVVAAVAAAPGAVSIAAAAAVVAVHHVSKVLQTPARS